MFNLRYACLRNVIERIFGVVKRRFQIFHKAPEYSQTTQVDFFYAVMWLHNFIKIHLGHEEDIYNAPMNIPDNTEVDNEGGTQQSDSTQMNAICNRMAKTIKSILRNR